MSEATETPEATDESQTEIIADTMLGTMVRFVIDEIRAMPDVWEKLDEFRQDDVIARATLRCTNIIGQVVNLIAADGREVIGCDLEQITAKDEIKAVCKVGKHDKNRYALLDSVGKRVLLVVVEPDAYLGGEIPKADPQQPDLPVATAGDDETAGQAQED